MRNEIDIHSAEIVNVCVDPDKCPEPDRPEYAFVGRSNVGKSSLINALVNRKKLAKASSSPGKTETINHYLVNESWYLVDLPGYGYAKKSKADRDKWIRFINKYMHNRQNLACVFLLVDGSIPPQKIDLEFMYDLGVAAIPFAIVLTKTDRLSKTKLKYNIKNFEEEISKNWESLPEMFISSAKNKSGRVEILTYIQSVNKTFEEKFS